MRGHDHRVSRPHLDGAVGTGGDPGEGRHGLTLRAGHDDGEVRVRDLADVLLIDEHRGWEVQVAELPRYVDVAHHGAARHGDEPIVPLGRLDDLAHAVDVAREGGDDDAPLRLLEDALEGRLDGLLARDVAGPLGVGRVAEESEDALVPQSRQAREIHRLALDGRQVDLVVAAEYYEPRVGAKRDRDRVRDGVVDVDKLQAEAAEPLLVACLNLPEVAPFYPELLELAPDEPQGELRAVHRNVELPQDVRQGADVVLVAVGEDDALELVLVLPEVGEVGKDQVDPGHLLVRERHPGVDEDDPALLPDGRHVLADLPQSSQGHDLQRVSVHQNFFLFSETVWIFAAASDRLRSRQRPCLS